MISLRNRRLHTLLALPLALALSWAACDSDTTPIDNPTDSSFQVMADAVLPYLNDSTDCPGVISAEALFNDGVENYTIIDLRSADDYKAGHIQGAVNATLGNLVSTVEGLNLAKDAPIVVACYTGQVAGHAKIALEMLGYENTKSLLFGMASWSSTLTGKMDGGVGDALTDAETTDNNPSLTKTYDPPTLTEPAETVVTDRVNKVLADGFKGISYADLVANGLENYFIVNYFGQADYLGTGEAGVPGHIPGAFQFTPYKSITADAFLANLPTDKPIVVYCWTGQHSSQVVAALNMLGYEALSLKFGSNALFHSALTAHKWGAGATHDYPLVTD